MSNCFILLIMHWAAYKINPQSVVAAPQWVLASISPGASSVSLSLCHLPFPAALLFGWISISNVQKHELPVNGQTTCLPRCAPATSTSFSSSVSLRDSLSLSLLAYLKHRLVIKVCRPARFSLSVGVCVCGAWSAFKLAKLCLVGVAIFVAACCASCSRWGQRAGGACLSRIKSHISPAMRF